MHETFSGREIAVRAGNSPRRSRAYVKMNEKLTGSVPRRSSQRRGSLLPGSVFITQCVMGTELGTKFKCENTTLHITLTALYKLQ